MYVSTFHLSKLTTRNWKIPALADFMESLTHENDKLIQMGTIKSTKEQALVSGISNQAKGKKKDLEQKEKEKKQSSSESSSSTDGSLRSRRRNTRERETQIWLFHRFTYLKIFLNK